MIFHDADFDPRSGLYCRKVSLSGCIEFGIWPVIYGFRIRAGYAFYADQFCELDWCGGSNQESVERLYCAMQTLLESREDHPSAFNGIPGVSARKPYTNDPEFIQTIEKLGGRFEDCDLPPLSTIRAKMLATMPPQLQLLIADDVEIPT